MLTITATVVSPVARTNTATITDADQFDPNTANNSGSATETPQHADLAIDKIVSDPTPNVGDQITFTVTLTNGGPDDATGRAGDRPAAGGPDLRVGQPQPGHLRQRHRACGRSARSAPAAPQTLTITATVVSPDAQTNTATVSDADQFDPITGNNTDSVTETPQRADLALTKSVDDPTPNVGDEIVFTVTLTNIGPDAATDVSVNDLLPAGLTLILATPSQGTYDSTAGLWTVGTVNAAASATLTLRALVASPAAQTNTATVGAADQFDPNTGNNTASATETPQQADLAVTKTVSDPTPNVGDTITFTVTLTNNGPDAATNVTVLDSLPAGLTFVSATASQGTYDAATRPVDGRHGGARQRLRPCRSWPPWSAPSPRTNTAAIGTADQFDPNTANNSGSATETPQQADLAVTKTVSDATPNVGDQITFTVTLTNSGPDAATGVQVTDLLPAGLTFVSATPSQGTYDDVTGLWDVGTVTPGRRRRCRSSPPSSAPPRRPTRRRSATPTSSTRTRATTPAAPPRRPSRPTWPSSRPSTTPRPTWASRSSTPSP